MLRSSVIWIGFNPILRKVLENSPMMPHRHPAARTQTGARRPHRFVRKLVCCFVLLLIVGYLVLSCIEIRIVGSGVAPSL